MWTTEKWLDLKQLLPWMACTGHFGYLSNYKNGTGREMRAHKEQNLFSLVHKHFRDQLQNVVELQRASWNNLLIKKCSEPILSTVARSQHNFIKKENDIPTPPLNGILWNQRCWKVCWKPAKILSLFSQNLDCFFSYKICRMWCIEKKTPTLMTQ